MIYEVLQKLIDYALKNNLISKEDVYVVRNELMELFGLSEWENNATQYDGETIDEILNSLTEYACKNDIIPDTINSRDLFDTKIMGILTPMPREVNSEFNKKHSQSPEKATQWYYDFSKKLNYVRAGRIAKDMKWEYDCEYGTLDITINLSKPEKDPKDIAKAKEQKSTSYPKCQLCPENAGFAGHLNHPARQNLRPVNLKVYDEEWQMQYSPYGYYNEHCIVFNTNHIPMKIDQSVFEKLFDVIDYIPHYFVGSNADLPIVGGSILSHEHFQGGKYTFAMEKAPVESEFAISAFPDVKLGIVKWPMSVIRAVSKDRYELSKCCTEILSKWRAYSDEEVGIFAETDGNAHNTITPIARKNGDMYECDLVLRNNITTKERPLGVFHPNPKLHHIKKENIGLIEVMGLAVLPARLKEEIALLKEAMLNEENIADMPKISKHADWAKDILLNHPDFCANNAEKIIKEEIGSIFLEVLKDAGVFKRTKAGKRAFLKFTQTL